MGGGDRLRCTAPCLVWAACVAAASGCLLVACPCPHPQLPVSQFRLSIVTDPVETVTAGADTLAQAVSPRALAPEISFTMITGCPRCTDMSLRTRGCSSGGDYRPHGLNPFTRWA